VWNISLTGEFSTVIFCFLQSQVVDLMYKMYGGRLRTLMLNFNLLCFFYKERKCVTVSLCICALLITFQPFNHPSQELMTLRNIHVHSVEQKSIGLKFSKSQTGSHVTYSCHHNSSRFTFPIFVHS